MGEEYEIVSGWGRAPTVCLAVHAPVVPDDAMAHAVFLGRDGWADFPLRKYVATNENKPVPTFTAREQRNAENAQRYSYSVNNAVGLVEPGSSKAVVARFAGKRIRIPNVVSLVKIDITNTDGTKAADGMYYTRFNSLISQWNTLRSCRPW